VEWDMMILSFWLLRFREAQTGRAASWWLGILTIETYGLDDWVGRRTRPSSASEQILLWPANPPVF